MSSRHPHSTPPPLSIQIRPNKPEEPFRSGDKLEGHIVFNLNASVPAQEGNSNDTIIVRGYVECCVKTPVLDLKTRDKVAQRAGLDKLPSNKASADNNSKASKLLPGKERTTHIEEHHYGYVFSTTKLSISDGEKTDHGDGTSRHLPFTLTFPESTVDLSPLPKVTDERTSGLEHPSHGVHHYHPRHPHHPFNDFGKSGKAEDRVNIHGVTTVPAPASTGTHSKGEGDARGDITVVWGVETYYSGPSSSSGASGSASEPNHGEVLAEEGLNVSEKKEIGVDNSSGHIETPGVTIRESLIFVPSTDVGSKVEEYLDHEKIKKEGIREMNTIEKTLPLTSNLSLPTGTVHSTVTVPKTTISRTDNSIRFTIALSLTPPKLSLGGLTSRSKERRIYAVECTLLRVKRWHHAARPDNTEASHVEPKHTEHHHDSAAHDRLEEEEVRSQAMPLTIDLTPHAEPRSYDMMFTLQPQRIGGPESSSIPADSLEPSTVLPGYESSYVLEIRLNPAHNPRSLVARVPILITTGEVGKEVLVNGKIGTKNVLNGVVVLP